MKHTIVNQVNDGMMCDLIHTFISSLKMYTVSYIIISGSNSYARLIAVMWF